MWDQKYRPMRFSDVLGQLGTIQLLKSRLRKGSALDTSYIFSGSHGMGKTTLARIYARAALCLNLNREDPEPCNECDNCTSILNREPGPFEERDAASSGTVETIREMIKDLPFSIQNAPKRIWLFDESHRMGIGAQDALLLPLEEKKVVGVFCTTEADKIRGPIRSRCEEYTIRKITREDILDRMKKILSSEGIPFEDDAVLTVIDQSGGHVRDVINKLEMVAQLGEVSLQNVREYLNLNLVSVYYEILLSLGDPKQALLLVEKACESVSADDVAAGLAEAAMNSYRLANGMHADFSYVDKALAQKVHETFGVNVVKLAEFFLRGRNLSKVNLICDVVSLGQHGGVPVAQTQIAAPIIVQTAALPSPTQERATTAATASPPSPSFAKPVPPTAPSNRVRPDGIGALGSGDVLALTELDDKGVPSKIPRSYAPSEAPIPFSIQALTTRQDDETRMIPPEQWRLEFDRTWPGMG